MKKKPKIGMGPCLALNTSIDLTQWGDGGGAGGEGRQGGGEGGGHGRLRQQLV